MRSKIRFLNMNEQYYIQLLLKFKVHVFELNEYWFLLKLLSELWSSYSCLRATMISFIEFFSERFQLLSLENISSLEYRVCIQFFSVWKLKFCRKIMSFGVFNNHQNRITAQVLLLYSPAQYFRHLSS